MVLGINSYSNNHYVRKNTNVISYQTGLYGTNVLQIPYVNNSTHTVY